MKRINKNIAGNSLTEFALVVPLMAIFINFTIYLNEVALEKIKPLDIGRYLAFAATDVPGSNYVYSYTYETNPCTDGRCTKRDMEDQRQAILENVKRIENTIGFGSKNAILQNNMEFEVKDTDLLSKNIESLNDLGASIDPGSFGGGIYEAIQNLAGGSIESLYNKTMKRLNFNLKGDVYVSASVKSNSAFFENLKAVDTAWQQMNIKTHKKESQVKDPIKTDWQFAIAYEMSVDSWKLEDGRNVQGGLSSGYKGYLPDSAYAHQPENDYYGHYSPFLEQVHAMWMGTLSLSKNAAGLTSKLTDNIGGDGKVQNGLKKGMGLVSNVFDFLKNALIPGAPFDVRLTSNAYNYDVPYTYENGIPVVAGMADIHYGAEESDKVKSMGTRYYHTLPMVEEELSNWTQGNHSEYYRTWDKRGQYFMGCPNKKQVKCTYDD